MMTGVSLKNVTAADKLYIDTEFSLYPNVAKVEGFQNQKEPLCIIN